MSKLIQWYPGHMTKTMRLIEENLSNIDIVFFVLDARIPISSLNPKLWELTKDKPKLLILNRNDLADSKMTDKFIQLFAEENLSAVAVSGKVVKLQNLDKLVSQIVSQHHKVTGDTHALISGVPNVGKSTIINHLLEKNILKTENRAGVTKKIVWQPTNKGYQLGDTPGLLWPKFDDQDQAYKLALTGAIADHIFYPDDVAIFLLEELRKSNQLNLIAERYNFADQFDDNLEIFDLIGKRTGFKDDYQKISWRLINDFRQGKLGRITLDNLPQKFEL